METSLKDLWQEKGGGCFPRAESDRAAGPVLPLICVGGEALLPHCASIACHDFYDSLNFYLESMQMMINLSYRKVVLPGS